MATVTDLGPCAGCCDSDMVTFICEEDAFEVPEALQVEFSNGTGVLACLNGLIYPLNYNANYRGSGLPRWEYPDDCFCFDNYLHDISLAVECSGNVLISTFRIVRRSFIGSDPPSGCGDSGSAQDFGGDPGSPTGNGATFAVSGTEVGTLAQIDYAVTAA